MNELGKPWFSNQKRSPYLRARNCSATRQARVGPKMAPGSGFSEMPPDQMSMSSGCLRAAAAAAGQVTAVVGTVNGGERGRRSVFVAEYVPDVMGTHVY